MNFESAAKYVGHYVDDAFSTHVQPIIEGKTVLVGWQCGFEPMFVAVNSYLDCRIDDDEAEGLAIDLLEEIGWFPEGSEYPVEADYIIR